MSQGGSTKPGAPGVTALAARRLLLALPGVVEGLHYSFPAFMVAGKFLARFRDNDQVLVVRLSSIADREVLMRLDPRAFFFTEHYRNFPAVLIRLAEIHRSRLAEVLENARALVASRGPGNKKRATRRGRRRRAP